VAAHGGGGVAGCWQEQMMASLGEGFEQKFKGLVGFIKIIYEPGFIVYVTSFQLAQKSSHLVMFWLPKMPSKVTKKISL